MLTFQMKFELESSCNLIKLGSYDEIYNKHGISKTSFKHH